MSDAPSVQYRPLWLTEEEHQRIFGELLGNPEGLKEERLADLLTKAHARSQGTPGLAYPARAGARKAFGLALIGMVVLTLLGLVLSMVGRR